MQCHPRERSTQENAGLFEIDRTEHRVRTLWPEISGKSIAEIRRLLELFRGDHVIGRSPVAVEIDDAGRGEGAGIARLDCLLEPFERLRLIPLHKKAVGVHRTDILHGVSIAHLGGLVEQFESHLIVLDCAQPPDIGEPEVRNRRVINQNISMKILR